MRQGPTGTDCLNHLKMLMITIAGRGFESVIEESY